MRHGFLLAVLAAICISIISEPVFAESRVALVIGNGRYINANILPNPPNDARSVSKTLRDIGFDVIEGTDLDHSGMERLLRDFLLKATNAKVALFFYAGHGLQVDGRNYLIPVDAKIESSADLNFGTVELDKILGSLDDPSRANIIILDACRDNPLARSFATRTRTASVSGGLAAYTALGTGTLIAFSTAPGKVAEDGGGINSPFTTSLVRHIATPGIEVRQMLTRVRADVTLATGEKQVPWDNSSLRGDVYLGEVSKLDGPRLSPSSVDDPAAQAWAEVKDISSEAVLQDFIRRYGDSFYAGLARARIDNLRKKQVEPMQATRTEPALPADENPKVPTAVRTKVGKSTPSSPIDDKSVRAPSRVRHASHVSDGHCEDYRDSTLRNRCIRFFSRH